MKKDKKGKKKGLKIDFTGVETRARIEDGQYHAKVAEITQEEGQQAPYLKWVFEVISDDKTNGRKLFYNTSLAPQALWNLRSLLETLGIEIPDEEMDLDLDEYIGLELMVRVENEVYEGKERPKVTDFTLIKETTSTEDDDEGEDDEEEEPDDDEGEDDEEEEDEEEEEGDDDEDEEEEEGEDDEEDDGKISADDVKEMDEKELADLVKKNGLKVDLKKFPKASKRIAAVIAALEKKGLLSD